MIKLYGIAFSNNVNKVRYCLNHLGLAFDWVQTNPLQGENKTPEFLAIAPTGKVPAIDIDGLKIFESNAIIRYLVTQHKSSLIPSDHAKRAIMDAWTDYVSIHVQQALGQVVFNRVLAPMVGQKTDEASIKSGLELLDKYFPVLEQQLSKNSHLVGSELTLADINLLAVLDPCEIAQVSLAKYPRMTQWRSKLKAQPFYQKCYKDYTLFMQDAMSVKK